MIRFDTRPNPSLAPGFLEAKNRRQKVRAAGLHPDYWYPVEKSENLKPGKAMEAKFWGRSIAVYRDHSGKVQAIEDRCAHRQLKLSMGEVKGCNLVCMYHGWEFGCDGKLISVPHDLFGKQFPHIRVSSFPVQERYGLIWIFPGNPDMKDVHKIPDIPELEGPNPWGVVSIDATWKAHHSMIIDNVSDFTHAYLHRKFKPFWDAKMTKLDAVGDKVYVSYDTQVGRGRIAGMFVDRENINTDHMDLCYEYPFQWSNTDNKIKHHLFVLPIDEQTTRGFFLFYFSGLKIPILNKPIPPRVLQKVLDIAKELHIRPLLAEDGVAVEEEQRGYNMYYDEPIAELNPAVNHFQQLTIRKWEEYLAESGSKKVAKVG